MKIAVAPNLVNVPSLVPKGGEGRSPQDKTEKENESNKIVSVETDDGNVREDDLLQEY